MLECGADLYLQALASTGWCIWEQVLGAEQLEPLRLALDKAYDYCLSIQKQSGLTHMAGTVHHILGLDQVFMDFLAELPVLSYLEHQLGGPVILNSFGGVLNHLTTDAYVKRIHRDQRSWSGDFALMCNLLVMLDDFHIDNGATWILSGSQHLPDRPTESDFWHQAVPICGPAGSLVLFDSLLWHAAGENITGEPRRAFTLTFSRPLMKPQFDYLAHLSETQIQQLAPQMQQLLGYYARIPTTLAEWYQPAEQRFYRREQG